VLQDDGDIAIIDSSNHTVWHTGTANSILGYLVMQTDGNLVLYK
jgi:hypothetical protein